MRSSIVHDNFKAMNIFKKNVIWIKEDATFKPIKNKEAGKIIQSLKNTNVRVDSEVTNRIIKTLHNYMSLALTHLGYQIFRTGVFPAVLKCLRILPLS